MASHALREEPTASTLCSNQASLQGTSQPEKLHHRLLRVEGASVLRGFACPPMETSNLNLGDIGIVCCRSQLQSLQEELTEVKRQLADAKQAAADMQSHMLEEGAAMHLVGEQQEQPKDAGMEACR